jgi:hypothetical protein
VRASESLATARLLLRRPTVTDARPRPIRSMAEYNAFITAKTTPSDRVGHHCAQVNG